MLDNGSGFHLRELIPFAGALITGAIGGCVASIQHARSRKEVMVAFAMGYIITGAFGGVVSLAVTNLFYPELAATWSHLFLVSGGGGVVVALSLAASNFSMKFILSKLGIELDIQVRRTRDDDDTDA